MFQYNEKEIGSKIIKLDGRLARFDQDIVIEEGENIALIIENKDHFLNNVTIIDEIIEN